VSVFTFGGSGVDTSEEVVFGAGSLSFKPAIWGFVVALVPRVLSLSAAAAASFGFASAQVDLPVASAPLTSPLFTCCL
jgi:hypothetical protein